MTSKYINALYLASATAAALLSGCSSSSGSASAGTQLTINAAASPQISAVQPAGAKTFVNDLGDTITLTKAYLVIASTTIETSCDASFSVNASDFLNFFIPQAQAHTSSTPTSTGTPYVINLLDADNVQASIGALSPPAASYCGADIAILAADNDAINLPTGAGEPDLIGKSIYLEGSYTLAAGGSGIINISTGAALRNRALLLATQVTLSDNSRSAEININIHYDTWFNAVDLETLETETAVVTSPLDNNVNQVLVNISNSLHQN
ncbi:MAG: hypothetical protein H8E21_13655 [Gammaproteobacteria bacterium]|nr:hypothetical protein [Gammaproteobacteria bacterium]MBL7001107.1 hypothetical protein [Gammaproteobacteria bacterium]